MSKQLYEDALADAKQIIALAEENARRAVVDAVTPRIKEIIDQQILAEERSNDDDVLLGVEDAAGRGDEPPMTTLGTSVSSDAAGNMYGVEPTPTPQAGDSPKRDAGETYELSLESVDRLVPVLSATDEAVLREFELKMYKVGDKITSLKHLAASKRVPRTLKLQINETIANVKNMYEYVNEALVASDVNKSLFNNRLETFFGELQQIRENTMKKPRLSESDVTFKVTGLPDDAADAVRTALSDPDSSEQIGIDIEVGEEDEAGGDELGVPEAGGDEAGASDAGGELDFDIGGDDAGGDAGAEGDEEEEEGLGESRRLSDDTIVEIDEGMLRREIKRMRALREEKWPSEILSDFGGGKDEGDAWLDGEVTTEAENLEDIEKCEEGDEMGTAAPKPPTAESLRRRVQFEQKNIARIGVRLTAIKEAAKKAGRGQKVAQLREAYNRASKRLSDAKMRLDRYNSLLVAEAKRTARTDQNGRSQRPAETAVVNELREKLAEQNLHNAKLSYTNKLLQAEGLTPKQKAQIIKSLDEARSLREVKLLYENLSTAMAAPRQQIAEGAKGRVLGSSSRATKPGQTELTEGVGDVERWTRLAGIK